MVVVKLMVVIMIVTFGKQGADYVVIVVVAIGASYFFTGGRGCTQILTSYKAHSLQQSDATLCYGNATL